MGFREFDQAETERVLAEERVIRIAFTGDDGHYLVPVFYVWHEGALCGLTTPGRKTAMAAANPRVAFQIDSTATTGPWAWSSVTGEGTWEVIRDPAVFGPFAAKMQAKLADSPAWAKAALQARFAKLGMVAFRIAPTRLEGRAHDPE